MSFGQAASRRTRVRRVADSAMCPCGSGVAFGGCCAPLLRGDPAPTAERLMRSRYTAFVIGDVDHLARSWHPRTRPETIDLDEDLSWTGLTIDAAEAGGVGDAEGLVEFTASWVQGSERGVLHERSRFVRLSGRWCYLDGEVG